MQQLLPSSQCTLLCTTLLRTIHSWCNLTCSSIWLLHHSTSMSWCQLVLSGLKHRTKERHLTTQIQQIIDYASIMFHYNHEDGHYCVHFYGLLSPGFIHIHFYQCILCGFMRLYLCHQLHVFILPWVEIHELVLYTSFHVLFVNVIGLRKRRMQVHVSVDSQICRTLGLLFGRYPQFETLSMLNHMPNQDILWY